MTQDGNGVVVPQNSATAGTGVSNDAPSLGTTSSGKFSDQQLLDMFKRWKKEAFDQRWIYERQWMRNVWYMLNRQWIYYDSKRGQWQDKRLAKWVPRPVTNILKDGVKAVRANFAAVNYSATSRPLGEDNQAVVTAGVADDYIPILHEDHKMDAVMNEFDFWMLVCGNAYLHTAVDHDRKYGMQTVLSEQCGTCQTVSTEVEISKNTGKCPTCNGTDLSPAVDPETGAQVQSQVIMPKGVTYALSPFEIAYPIMYNTFDDAPVVHRMRWRDKSYYEQHPEFSKTYAKTLSFSKTPQERTMQIFKTLPFQGDIGITPPYFASGGANVDTEGIVEYDVWVRPCEDFPEGQVIRIAGDSTPTVIHSEQESLPGPLPYHDGAGNPIFTFHAARYEHVGGRSYGSSMIDPAIQKQDQLNQLDSHMLMIIGRMANPIWLEPKGAEVEKFTGEPGLVVKWNPLVAGGHAKPERIPGEGINASVFQYRELIKQEAEELMGTYNILKGEQPQGVDAYATTSLLLERAQGNHASAYKERGRAYKGWVKDALSIEQEFGEETRIRAVMAPTKGWAFKTFQKADLSGNVEIIIEDGTLTPKTSLGERAAIDHLAQLGLIDPSDPDQRSEIFRKFGQQGLMPATDAQVQEAWMNMEKFEQFINNPIEVAKAGAQAKLEELQQQSQQLSTGMAAIAPGAQAPAPPPPLPPVGPLVYRRWYNPQIHRNELIKWCLSDRGRKVFQDHPAAMGMVDAYLSSIDIALAQQAMGIVDAAGVPINTAAPAGAGQPAAAGATAQPGPGGPTPGDAPNQQGNHGAAEAMSNSNRNAAGAGPTSSGAAGAGAGASKQPNALTISADAKATRYLNKNPLH